MRFRSSIASQPATNAFIVDLVPDKDSARANHTKPTNLQWNHFGVKGMEATKLLELSKLLTVVLSLFLLPPGASAQPVESLAGTLPRSGDYGEVLAAIEAIGADATSLTLYWDELVDSGVYVADPDWPAIAELVYPPRNTRIQLTFAVIDTLADRRPHELRGLAWNDPRVVKSFLAFADEVLSRMPNIDLVSIAIGNEVDGHFRDDEIDEYASFFEQARTALRATRPDVPVTVKLTWPGLRGRPKVRALARQGDALSITWYPMNEDFHFREPGDALEEMSEMAAISNGPWELSEVGYPSNGCGASSEEAQAAFHMGLAEAQTSYPELTLVQRVWSHDIAAAQVSAYVDYYNSEDSCFLAFLNSLGLLTANGRAKPAFTALVER